MLPDNITRARESAQGAAEVAGNYSAGAHEIGDILKEKVLNVYNNNQDIIGKLDTSTQNYLQAPQVGREQFQNIFNPFTREKLVSQYTGTQALPMLSYSSILGQRFGRIDDTIGAGTRSYQALSDAATNAASLKQSLYENLLSEYTTSETIRAQQEADRLAREKFEFDKIQANKKSGGGDMASLLALLGIGGDENSDEYEDITDTVIRQSVPAARPTTPAQSWNPTQGWPSPFSVLQGLSSNAPPPQSKPQSRPANQVMGWPRPPGY